MSQYFHETLPSGVEFAAESMTDRRTVSLEIRVLSGTADEPIDKLGLARIVEDTLDKGTAAHNGRALSDAFDALGIRRSGWTGREATGVTCTLLPDVIDDGLALIAELIRTPTFPADACRVAVELALQELHSLEDDPGELADRLLSERTYGPILGRHPLGDAETLKSITPDDVRRHWSSQYAAGRMQISCCGPIDAGRVAARIDSLFTGFGDARPTGRSSFAVAFAPSRTHVQKELEQVQIGIGFPGAALSHPDYPVQRVIIGILSDGMSSRLFSEVREKQGLAYSVSAWDEYPRGAGMIFLHASTTPERCEKTYTTLLREIDRIGEDVTDAERSRVIKGIVARTATRGDITRAHTAELAGDLFHYGRPVPIEEKLDAVRAVTIGDIRRYLNTYKRNALSVVTLGPKSLEG